MYDIVVTSANTNQTSRIHYTVKGQLMVAVDGPYQGDVLLNVGSDTFVNLTTLNKTSERIYNHSFTVRLLQTSEAITLIVRG